MVQLRTAALVFEDGELSHIVNRIPFRYRRVCAVQFYLRSKFDANTCSENCAAAVRSDDLSKCCDGQAACSTQTCPTATHVNKPDYDSLKCAGAMCEPDFSECCDVKADDPWESTGPSDEPSTGPSEDVKADDPWGSTGPSDEPSTGPSEAHTFSHFLTLSHTFLGPSRTFWGPSRHFQNSLNIL